MQVIDDDDDDEIDEDFAVISLLNIFFLTSGY